LSIGGGESVIRSVATGSMLGFFDRNGQAIFNHLFGYGDGKAM